MRRMVFPNEDDIYLLLKRFGDHSTLPVDAVDGEKALNFVSVLKAKENKWHFAANQIFIENSIC